MDLGIDPAAQAASEAAAPSAGRRSGSEALAALFAAFVADLLPSDVASGAEASEGAPAPHAGATEGDEPVPAGTDDQEEDAMGIVPEVDVLSLLGLGSAALPLLPEAQQPTAAAQGSPTGVGNAAAAAGVPADPAVPARDGAGDVHPDAARQAAPGAGLESAAVAADVNVAGGPAALTTDAAVSGEGSVDVAHDTEAADGRAEARPDPGDPVLVSREKGQAAVDSIRSLSPAGRALARALGVLTGRQALSAVPAAPPAAEGASPSTPAGGGVPPASLAAQAPPTAAASSTSPIGAGPADQDSDPLTERLVRAFAPAAGQPGAASGTSTSASGGAGATPGAGTAAPGASSAAAAASGAAAAPAAAASARGEAAPAEAGTTSARPPAAGGDADLLLRGAPSAPAPSAGSGPGIQASSDGSISLASALRLEEGGDQQELAGQLVKAIRLQVKDGIGTARVQLRPEHLGEVQIELTVAKDRVSAVVHAERADVRAQIEAQGPALRAGLNGAGLHLEELTVRDDAPQRDRSGSRQRPPDEQRRRRRDESEKEFVLVA